MRHDLITTKTGIYALTDEVFRILLAPTEPVGKAFGRSTSSCCHRFLYVAMATRSPGSRLGIQFFPEPGRRNECERPNLGGPQTAGMIESECWKKGTKKGMHDARRHAGWVVPWVCQHPPVVSVNESQEYTDTSTKRSRRCLA